MPSNKTREANLMKMRGKIGRELKAFSDDYKMKQPQIEAFEPWLAKATTYFAEKYGYIVSDTDMRELRLLHSVTADPEMAIEFIMKDINAEPNLFPGRKPNHWEKSSTAIH